MEAVEVLEKSIIGEMLTIQDNPKEKCIGEHRINNFATMLQERAGYVLDFIKEEGQLKR